MQFADKILAAIDLPPVDTGAIPEWNIKAGELFQRGMTGLERRKFELLFLPDSMGNRPEGDPRATAVAFTLCDSGGRRVFADEQIPQLAAKNSAVLDRLYAAAVKLSGLDGAGDEDKIKNSEQTSGSGSSSD